MLPDIPQCPQGGKNRHSENVISRVPRVAGGVWSEIEARVETQMTVGHGDQGSRGPQTGVQRLGKVRPVLTEN